MKEEIICYEIHRGKHSETLENLLNLVDNGNAYIQGGIGLNNELLINITTKRDRITYYKRFPFSWKDFNEKYGKDYLDNFNLSFL